LAINPEKRIQANHAKIDAEKPNIKSMIISNLKFIYEEDTAPKHFQTNRKN